MLCESFPDTQVIIGWVVNMAAAIGVLTLWLSDMFKKNAAKKITRAQRKNADFTLPCQRAFRCCLCFDISHLIFH